MCLEFPRIAYVHSAPTTPVTTFITISDPISRPIPMVDTISKVDLICHDGPIPMVGRPHAQESYPLYASWTYVLERSNLLFLSCIHHYVSGVPEDCVCGLGSDRAAHPVHHRAKLVSLGKPARCKEIEGYGNSVRLPREIHSL